MKCRHAKKLIFDYIDGMLSDQDRIGLERHLSDCRSCDEMATDLNKSLDLLHRLPPVEPDENFNWKLRLRLAREKNALPGDVASERLWFKWWNTRFALSALSAFVIVVAAGVIMLRAGLGPGVGPGSEPGINFRAMPQVTGNTSRSEDGERPSTTPVVTSRRAQPIIPYFDVSFNDGPRLVSMPLGSSAAYDTPMQRSNEPVIDLDSLRTRWFHAHRETYRIRQLEQQVELLQNELQKCSTAADPAEGAGAEQK
jgi:hypothetical protein